MTTTYEDFVEMCNSSIKAGDFVCFLQCNDQPRKTKVLTEKNYEKDFFSEATNKVFCMTFMENALRDPITNEIGKGIISRLQTTIHYMRI